MDRPSSMRLVVAVVIWMVAAVMVVEGKDNVYTHRAGALAAGFNLGKPQNVTVAEAEVICNSMSACVGFTFKSSEATPAGPTMTYFKASSSGNTDPTWQTYTRDLPWMQVLQLVKMEGQAKEKGAVCLDGTPGAFYWAPAWDKNLSTTWVLFFEGGGWCYSEGDCVNRAHQPLGSSTSYAPNMTQTGYTSGIFGPNPALIPDFAGANHVYMKYCDGNSFAGMHDGVVNNTGFPLYFRGRRILDAVIETLSKNETYGLSEATDVLLSGCSAGGLATYLHADYVGDQVRQVAPKLKRFKAASCSGFFLDHPNAEGIPVYREQMQSIYSLSNASAGLNSACISAQGPDDKWKCNMAPYVYPHISTPFMVMNSALDSWQTSCILASERSSVGASNCAVSPTFKNEKCYCASYGSQIESCCDAHMFSILDDYEQAFMKVLTSSASYNKPGNGAFVYSCYTHCADSQNLMYAITIANTTEQAAVSKWWNSSPDAPPLHFEPCTWAGPNKTDCNPTCPNELAPSVQYAEIYDPRIYNHKPEMLHYRGNEATPRRIAVSRKRLA